MDKTIYSVKTNFNREFWVLATSPGRAMSKLKARRKDLLDRKEVITGVTEAGTIDVE